MTPLINVNNVSRHFPVRHGLLGRSRVVRAVDGVSLTVGQRQTYSLVGESGSGKSTLGRLILRLIRPEAGQITWQQRGDVWELHGPDLKAFHRDVQAVFQDPASSLNPRMKIWEIVGEPLIAAAGASRKEALDRSAEVAVQLGLKRHHLDSFPHQLSGGQRQRVAIARAISVNPNLIVFDEPLSSLDVSIKAQVLELITRIQEETQKSYFWITHDLATVKYLGGVIGVMYRGKIVEEAPADELLDMPLHPYSQALARAARTTKADHAASPVDGRNDLEDAPTGCLYKTRCPFANERCRLEEPLLRQVTSDHHVACHLYV